MTDSPRLLGRVAGATSGRSWAMRTRDADGEEPERIEREIEEQLATEADPINAAHREANRLRREIGEHEARFRRSIGKGHRISAAACVRAVKRKRRRIEALEAKVGELRSRRAEPDPTDLRREAAEQRERREWDQHGGGYDLEGRLP